MTVQFVPVTKTQAKLRMAISGPAGAGKTMTALRIAKGLSAKKPALIDTEAGSASKYADILPFDGLVLTTFSPQHYIDAIASAEQGGYEVVILDSLTHEWQYVLEDVDRRKAAARNQFTAWAEPSRFHQQLVEKILQSTIHVIATMRSKMEYAVDGSTVKKLGLAPVQRDDLPYVFDVVLDLDHKHNATVSKSRIAVLADQIISKPGEELGGQLRAWLSEGAPAPVAASPLPLIAGTSMDGEIRARIEARRIFAQANAETKPLYDAAAVLLKAAQFKGWKDFFEHGTQAQAEAVERALNGADQPELVTA